LSTSSWEFQSFRNKNTITRLISFALSLPITTNRGLLPVGVFISLFKFLATATLILRQSFACNRHISATFFYFFLKICRYTPTYFMYPAKTCRVKAKPATDIRSEGQSLPI
tara:strand:- start:579 stop:911 length:333 start_codon:yes stop_codon:yes gene_type:complete